MLLMLLMSRLRAGAADVEATCCCRNGGLCRYNRGCKPVLLV